MDYKQLFSKENLIIGLLVIIMIQTYLLFDSRNVKIDAIERYSGYATEQNNNLENDLQLLQREVEALREALESNSY